MRLRVVVACRWNCKARSPTACLQLCLASRVCQEHCPAQEASYERQAVAGLAVVVACGHKEVTDKRVLQMQELFASSPPVPFYVGFTSHKHIITEYLNACLVGTVSCSFKPGNKQRGYLRCEAYALVPKKHQLVKSLNWFGPSSCR